MEDEPSSTALVIRIAVPEDIPSIEQLDSFSESARREIHRDIEKYFGSIDPSTHEHTCIFLAEMNGTIAGKAELMLPPLEAVHAIGYIKRVVVHPDFRGRGIAKQLFQHILRFAHTEYALRAIDLHVVETNRTAIQLYESLGFELQHRERYYRLSF